MTYKELIEIAKQENEIRHQKHLTENCYYEGHHILPRYLGGTGDSRNWNDSNIVHLTLGEHVNAHYLLALENENNSEQYYGNLHACIQMLGIRKTKSHHNKRQEIEKLLQNVEYLQQVEDAKKRLQGRPGKNLGKKFPQNRTWIQIGNQVPKHIGDKYLEAFKQKGMCNNDGYSVIILTDCPICHKPNSPESFACSLEHKTMYLEQLQKQKHFAKKEEMKKTWHGSTPEEITERNRKIGEANKLHINERCWITNGTINKVHLFVDPMPEGYYIGRIVKGVPRTEEQKARLKGVQGIGCYVHKDDIVKRVTQEQLALYLQNGWIRGTIDRDKNRIGRKHAKRTKIIWVYNDIKRKMCSEEELPELLQHGWKCGRGSFSSETKSKLSASAKNKTWIKHPDFQKAKKVLNDELDQYFAQGWTKGRPKFSDASKELMRKAIHTRGKVWMRNVNLQQSKMIDPSELDSYLQNGWVRGRQHVWEQICKKH